MALPAGCIKNKEIKQKKKKEGEAQCGNKSLRFVFPLLLKLPPNSIVHSDGADVWFPET